jgi:hypothetical protein
MNKYLATVILGVVRLLSTIVACISLRACGRRPLTLISGISTFTFGTSLKTNQIKSNHVEECMVVWVAVLCSLETVLSELHGAVTEKIVLFIVTLIRTSNPTNMCRFYMNFFCYLMLTAIGCGLTMIGLGSYMYVKEGWVAEGVEPKATWIPVACIFIFTIASTLGYLVVPWVMIGEVFPTQVKYLTSTLHFALM